MARPTRKMVNLSIEETSGVDHPAHLHEGWLVMKSVGGEAVEELLDEVATPSAEAEDTPDSGDEPSVLKSTESEDPMDLEVEKQDGAEVIEKQQPSYEDMADELEKAKARIAELEAGMMKAADPASEELLKEAPEEVRKAFEDMQKAIEDARVQKEAVEAELRKEREERADADAVVKAREAFAALGLDAEKVGPALRRLGETDADLAKSVEDILTAANAKVESGDIFSEIGKSATFSGGNAYERAEAMAKAAVEAGTAATFEQALSDVFLTEKDLYKSYLAEQGK